jgi:polyhydroxyalkanoate synthesis repressor PhaR
MTAAGTSEKNRARGRESEIVPIKRYPNRRFYDRRVSKYVTLQDIEELVRQGHTIEVRDSKNDEDLTRVVLTQILLERHPDRIEMFPIALLHTILRANDLALEFSRAFLQMSLATLERFHGSSDLAPFVSPLEWMRIFFPGLTPSPRNPVESSDATVNQLVSRLAELEGRIKQLESSATDQQSSLPAQIKSPQVPERHHRKSGDRPPD